MEKFGETDNSQFLDYKNIFLGVGRQPPSEE
jgi:hypothetical protein